ncbi:MAG: DUF2202 domain-containing protein [Acidobacteriota bacterium]|nr:MAG: DUF2202 domain-containing protein [Acidobacteriota bacterium]
MLKTLFLAAVAATLPACGGTPVSENSAVNEPAPVVQEQVKETRAAENECRICDFDHEAYKGPLSKEEVDGLLLALNDEYLAWATYDRVNKDFNDPRPFVNIQQAEGRHIERLKTLFAAYGVQVPENRWIGSEPQFKSLQEACKAGVDGEIANRDLYTRLFETTKREDITLVYKALQSASEDNHLPAFQRCIESGGGNGRGRGYGRGANRGS